MNKEEQLACWPRISVTRFLTLLKYFKTLDNVWSASAQDLAILPWKPDLITDFVNWRHSSRESCAAQAELLQTNELQLLTHNHPDWPTSFQGMYDPPYALLVRGQLQNQLPRLAVVGSRRPTSYGRQITHKLVTPLAEHGLSIISGLAHGIDSEAHQATLNASGHTIAILGHGAAWTDFGTDHQRRQLAEKILAAGGAIVSEYWPGTPGSNYTFPKRNRLIAGLSQATLIVEAGLKSGSLITARYALDNGREVLAVPHPALSTAGSGGNNLIKEGATLVDSVADIWPLFSNTNLSISTRPTLSAEAQAIISLLEREPYDRDAIARTLMITPSQIALTLTNLEIQGMISLENNLYHVT